MHARFDALVKPAPSQKRKSRRVGALARMRMETMRKLIAMGVMRMKRAKSTKTMTMMLAIVQSLIYKPTSCVIKDERMTSVN
jgi:hypothetical protein